MKPLTNWMTITPCLVVSLFLADFARVNADTPGQGKKKPPAKQV
ncbi:MAG: hypothetical protein JWO82_3832, partial [Akkermansiaceae bacterium]|nr:hypothetical protein [Akkermansiaceae bacterium]